MHAWNSPKEQENQPAWHRLGLILGLAACLNKWATESSGCCESLRIPHLCNLNCRISSETHRCDMPKVVNNSWMASGRRGHDIGDTASPGQGTSAGLPWDNDSLPGPQLESGFVTGLPVSGFIHFRWVCWAIKMLESISVIHTAVPIRVKGSRFGLHSQISFSSLPEGCRRLCVLTFSRNHSCSSFEWKVDFFHLNYRLGFPW